MRRLGGESEGGVCWAGRARRISCLSHLCTSSESPARTCAIICAHLQSHQHAHVLSFVHIFRVTSTHMCYHLCTSSESPARTCAINSLCHFDAFTLRISTSLYEAFQSAPDKALPGACSCFCWLSNGTPLWIIPGVSTARAVAETIAQTPQLSVPRCTGISAANDGNPLALRAVM